ncbi:hypothetical protein BKA81DRAFT_23203 [Phyllosticta paracitricarpa]
MASNVLWKLCISSRLVSCSPCPASTMVHKYISGPPLRAISATEAAVRRSKTGAAPHLRFPPIKQVHPAATAAVAKERAVFHFPRISESDADRRQPYRIDHERVKEASKSTWGE